MICSRRYVEYLNQLCKVLMVIDVVVAFYRNIGFVC